MNFRAMHWRLMTVFALFTLAVTLLFGLFAMAFVYTIEDAFIERQLQQEAERQRSLQSAPHTWVSPLQSFIQLHTTETTLPTDMVDAWRSQPQRHEFFGQEGRHYHVLPLTDARLPMLVAEVSAILIVRPMRGELLSWLAGWGGAMVLLALLLGGWLARRISAPLQRLAAAASEADPAHLPLALPGTERSDEVGIVARALQTLMQRTRDFIGREQAFTRDASHELRTPLSVMGMALNRAHAATPPDSAARAPLEAAAAATTHMTQTVNTLLMLAREEPACVTQPCRVLPQVEQWVLANEAQLGMRQLTLDINLDASATLHLPADVARMSIASLLDNAVAHGAPGSVIRLRHARDPLGQDTVIIANASAPLPTGAGIPGVKGSASAGFGLGLSIVRRLLARHGCTLDIAHDDGITTAKLSSGTTQQPGTFSHPTPGGR